MWNGGPEQGNQPQPPTGPPIPQIPGMPGMPPQIPQQIPKGMMMPPQPFFGPMVNSYPMAVMGQRFPPQQRQNKKKGTHKATKPPVMTNLNIPAFLTGRIDASHIQCVSGMSDDRLDLLCRLFEIETPNKKREVRIDKFVKEYFPRITKTNTQGYVQNVCNLIEMFLQMNDDLLLQWRESPIPAIFQRWPGYHTLLRLIPPQQSRGRTFEFRTNDIPDYVIMIGSFITVPHVAQVSAVITIDGREAQPVNFGEQDRYFIIMGERSSSSESVQVKVTSHMQDVVVWFAINYVSIRPNFVREFCASRGFPLGENLSALIHTFKCEPSCEPFDFEHFVMETGRTGFAECPYCRARVLLTEVRIDGSMQKGPTQLTVATPTVTETTTPTPTPIVTPIQTPVPPPTPSVPTPILPQAARTSSKPAKESNPPKQTRARKQRSPEPVTSPIPVPTTSPVTPQMSPASPETDAICTPRSDAAVVTKHVSGMQNLAKSEIHYEMIPVEETQEDRNIRMTMIQIMGVRLKPYKPIISDVQSILSDDEQFQDWVDASDDLYGDVTS